jgi:hypothetical protein
MENETRSASILRRAKAAGGMHRLPPAGHLRELLCVAFGVMVGLGLVSAARAECGNRTCDAAESPQDCGRDCCRSAPGMPGGGCGDGACMGFGCGEDPEVCPRDCGRTCGDGVCEAGETPERCPPDCDVSGCGDRRCQGVESFESCPVDCGLSSCGDGRCTFGESYIQCGADCSVQNDGICGPVEMGLILAGRGALDCAVRCGDGRCEADESPTTCPADCERCPDCEKTCGNGCCDGSEGPDSCPGDCVANACGDGQCDVFESMDSCRSDCAVLCGDGTCSSWDFIHCPTDCRGVCGDLRCAAGESARSCPVDCGASPVDPSVWLGPRSVAGAVEFCGDGRCQLGEDGASCDLDCPAECGDGICASEERLRCMDDCRRGCGDGACDESESAEWCPMDCATRCGDGECEFGESPENCPPDCAMEVCGDGHCRRGESYAECPLDCRGIVCGDGECSGTEDPASCPTDCGSHCGDGVCDGGESTEICPLDCPLCGDRVCGRLELKACPQDCRAACGDGICSLGEDYALCPHDCASSEPATLPAPSDGCADAQVGSEPLLDAGASLDAERSPPDSTARDQGLTSMDSASSPHADRSAPRPRHSPGCQGAATVQPVSGVRDTIALGVLLVVWTKRRQRSRRAAESHRPKIPAPLSPQPWVATSSATSPGRPPTLLERAAPWHPTRARLTTRSRWRSRAQDKATPGGPLEQRHRRGDGPWCWLSARASSAGRKSREVVRGSSEPRPARASRHSQRSPTP